ncbi:MAG TPA: CAP domain-containing protein [Bacteroidales bacterium]|nr:CAP domain-containing protein [Bacteroidales bacterium]
MTAKFKTLVILALLPLFFGASTPVQLSADEMLQSDLLKMEEEVLVYVNEYRASNGKPKLAMNEFMRGQCRDHSTKMASGATSFGHDGFDERTDLIWAQVGSGAIAENVAYNYSGAREAVNQWINSTGHRENMLGDYTLTGIGIYKTGNQIYFTQMFLRK